MTDPRPRPKYGEYAPIEHAPLAPPEPVAGPEAPPAPQRQPWDAALTGILLAIGTFDVVSSWAQIADLPGSLQSLYAAQGIGDYTANDLATTLGLVANLTRAAILVTVIVISLVRIQRVKRAVWVPIFGGVAGALTLVVCIAIAMLGDPAMNAFLQSRAG